MKLKFVNRNVNLCGIYNGMPKIRVLGGFDYLDYESFIDARKDLVYNLFEKSKKSETEFDFCTLYEQRGR